MVVFGDDAVFWHTVGSWNNRPAWFPSGSGWFVFFLVSRAWPKPGKWRPVRGVCLVVGVTGLLFGNCIVDASIL